MRPLDEVRLAILNVIEDGMVHDDLKYSTQSLIDSFHYTAPEAIPYRWGEFSMAMQTVFNRPHHSRILLPEETEWGWKAIQILAGQLDYRDYLE